MRQNHPLRRHRVSSLPPLKPALLVPSHDFSRDYEMDTGNIRVDPGSMRMDAESMEAEIDTPATT